MTPFAKKVYKAVLSIPLGETRSYKWVAKRIGLPKASRAVGQALNKNPYLLVIPCHRVVKSDYKIGGYALGVKKKEMLLELERMIASCLQNKE